MPGAYPVVQSYSKGQARNRQVTALNATRESVTWNAGVNEVTLTAINEASTTPTLNSIGVCFGSPTDSAA